MISFIYYDVGGTLLDWKDVFENAASKFNIDPEDIGKVFDENHDDITKGVLATKDFWRKCVQKYQLKNADDFDFLYSWVSDYKPITEMHNIVKEFSKNYKVGLLSNIYQGMLPILLDEKIIPNIKYDQIIFSCDVGMMKPERNIYELAQDKAGVQPEQILMVDDREDYLQGARALGWKTFLYKSSTSSGSASKLHDLLSSGN